jgi:mono/diheme cytochrome c family protein
MMPISLVSRRLLYVLAIVPALTSAGCKATLPGKAESSVIEALKHHITVRDKDVKNPLKQNASTLADGKQAFNYYCIACHGKDGQNTGVPFANHLSPPPPSLPSKTVQDYTDGQLKWIINYGLFPSGMPGAEDILSDDEQWAIVAYLRHLPPAGSQGVPEFYPH